VTETSLRRLTSVGGLLVALAILLSAAPAVGQTDDDGGGRVDPGVVSIVEVSGLLDPILVDFIETAIRDAEAAGDRYLILNMNSPGAVAPDADLAELAQTIADADVPVASWVGPSGSQALGGAAQIVSVTEPIGIAPGSRIGDTGSSVLPAELGEPFGEHADLLRDDTVGAERAVELGIAAEPAPTIGQFAITLPGFETQEVTQDGRPSLEPLTVVRFGELDLVSQLFHTVASPPVTYLLLAIGMALIVFELFTAGVGIAGLVGAASVILSCYGLWVLPVRWWAVMFVLLSFVAFSVDVQTGVPRTWTGIGFALFAIGTFWFYDGVSVSWVTLVAAFVGIALTYIGGMPAMVRTRFSTPTIGREWMIGEPGLARGAVDPDGVVIVQGAPWRARTNRATPIADGEAVRVVSLEGLLLEVEPQEGAARDHRERDDDH
jgi:membrane-bound serine protease (ClpP class)